MNNINKLGVGGVEPDERGHALEERLGGVEAGDPAEPLHPLPGVARHVRAQAVPD